jgi:hypothetical protein
VGVKGYRLSSKVREFIFELSISKAYSATMKYMTSTRMTGIG